MYVIKTAADVVICIYVDITLKIIALLGKCNTVINVMTAITLITLP